MALVQSVVKQFFFARQAEGLEFAHKESGAHFPNET